MTSIAVSKIGSYTAEDRSWIATDHGVDMTPSITLDVSKFTKATHYADGSVKSGTVLGKVTATGLYGPYKSDATDGREVAAGHLFGTLPVEGKTKVGGALYIHGLVTEARLPANHGLDAAAKTALSLIRYV